MALDRERKTTTKRLPASGGRSSSATKRSSSVPNKPAPSPKKRISSAQQGEASASSSSRTGSIDSLDAAITLLSEACRGEKRTVAAQDVKIAVGRIQQSAEMTGVSEADLERLVDVAGCGRLNKTLSRQIIKCLVPCSTVPHSAVTRAVSWICCCSADSDTRMWLLRWLLVVYDYIDRAEILLWLYGPLFTMLHRLELRAYVCDLLSRVTRRDNVKMFRVQTLIQMIKLPGVGVNSASGNTAVVPASSRTELVSLLAVYKLYCPHLVPISLSPVGRTQYSKKRDRLWLAQVARVVSRQAPSIDRLRLDLSINSSQAVAATAAKATAVTTTAATAANTTAVTGVAATAVVTQLGGTKRLKLVSAVPSVNFVSTVTLQRSRDSLALTPRHSSVRRQSISASQIRDFDTLLRNISNTELPDQIAVILRNKNLQYLFAYSNQPTSRMRLNYWLDHTLYTEFFGCSTLEHRQRELLELLTQLSQFLQEGIPACETFLSSYLPVWNGRANRDLILHLVTRWRLCDFTILQNSVLQYLHTIYVSATEYCKLDILMCLTELLRNFLSVEWQRCRSSRRQSSAEGATSSSSSSSSSYLFSQEVEELDALDCISSLIGYVDELCVLAMRAHNYSLLVLHVALSFFELAADMFPRYSVPLVCAPSRSLVYSCLLHRNASILSRLCSVIVRFRTSCVSLRTTNNVHWTDREHVARKQSLSNNVPVLNEYITTMCDVIWKGKLLFLDQDTLSNLSSSDTGFSIYQHMALLPYVRHFISETQPEGYVGRPSLIRTCRDTYLTYLSHQGLEGISNFVTSSVRRHSSNNSQQQSSQQQSSQQLGNQS